MKIALAYHDRLHVEVLWENVWKCLFANILIYAQPHYFLNLSQLLYFLPLLDKLINPGVSDYCCCDY